jgi:3-methylfumaryl-CoA hydratase
VINLERAREWLGRVDVRDDVAAPSALAALYDLMRSREGPPEVGAELPPLAHWLYFSSWGRLSDAGESGEHRDPSLPPIELPRHFCVDCRIAYHRPIRVGDPISRVMRVVDLGSETGRAGPKVTLLLRCEISDLEGVALSEERRLLYMARAEPWPLDPLRHARPPAQWTQDYQPNTRSLFRYAALTHDMNRVHYDRPFAVFVERHNGLVVPSELVSALLIELARERAAGARITRVEIRVRRWLYDTAPVRLCARWASADAIALWAEDQTGDIAIEGLVTLLAPVSSPN